MEHSSLGLTFRIVPRKVLGHVLIVVAVAAIRNAPLNGPGAGRVRFRDMGNRLGPGGQRRALWGVWFRPALQGIANAPEYHAMPTMRPVRIMESFRNRRVVGRRLRWRRSRGRFWAAFRRGVTTILSAWHWGQ